MKSGVPFGHCHDGLDEIIVTGREPRYVAPTLRDRIGRIWALIIDYRRHELQIRMGGVT